MASATPRSEFKNISPGTVGVVIMDESGRPNGEAVKPDQTVWLTEAEEIATANAPRRDEDNPFRKGWLVMVTAARDIKSRRPIGSTTEGIAEPGVAEVEAQPTGNDPVPPPEEVKPSTEEEVGAPPPLPEGDPEHGVRPPGEEVGTPEAVPRASAKERRPGPTRGKTVRADNPAARPAPEPGVAKAVVVGQGGAQYQEPTAKP